MRIYDIYQSEDQEIGASLVVHDDGRKEWDWSRNEWQGQVWYDDLKTAVEWAVDHNPQMESWTHQQFRIRRSQSV